MTDELQDIISGKKQVRHGAIIQAAASYLRRSTQTGNLAKQDKHFKKQEEEALRKFITENKLWTNDIDLSNYVSEGAEQKVYLRDDKSVSKLNDAIYYSSWFDYFCNLLLHNYFFHDTTYELTGFYNEKNTLYACVSQPFVKATEKTDLQKVKEFMFANDFENLRNNDYRNTELGIIIEDLHDENVLTVNGVLKFIDTVFYIIENEQLH